MFDAVHVDSNAMPLKMSGTDRKDTPQVVIVIPCLKRYSDRRHRFDLVKPKHGRRNIMH